MLDEMEASNSESLGRSLALSGLANRIEMVVTSFGDESNDHRSVIRDIIATP